MSRNLALGFWLIQLHQLLKELVCRCELTSTSAFCFSILRVDFNQWIGEDLQDFENDTAFCFPKYWKLFFIFLFCFVFLPPPQPKCAGPLVMLWWQNICSGWPSVWLLSPCRFLILCLPNEQRQSFFLLYSLTTCQASSVSSCVRCFRLFSCALPVKPRARVTVKYLGDVRKRSEHIPAHSPSIPLRLLCSTALSVWFSASFHRSCNHTPVCFTSHIRSNHSVLFYFWQRFYQNSFGSAFIMLTMLFAKFPSIVYNVNITFF